MQIMSTFFFLLTSPLVVKKKKEYWMIKGEIITLLFYWNQCEFGEKKITLHIYHISFKTVFSSMHW